MKNIMLLLGALIIGVALFTGCTSTAPSSSTDVNTNQEVQPSAEENTNKTGNESPEQAKKDEKEINQEISEAIYDSGRYQGQVDSNFIEIYISGAPDETAAKVFMLSEEVKAKFDKMDLQKDDVVKFKYFENEYGQLVIAEMTQI